MIKRLFFRALEALGIRFTGPQRVFLSPYFTIFFNNSAAIPSKNNSSANKNLPLQLQYANSNSLLGIQRINIKFD